MDGDGFSAKKVKTRDFPLERGDHLIQFAVESRIEPDLISSFWQTKENSTKGHHKVESEAEVAIKRITFQGAASGGAYTCEKCPEGTFSPIASYQC